MAIQKTILKANVEVANGRLWRAKEILGSSVSTYGYSREIFESLGNVLLQMGEIPEAGKCFLLSVDSPDQQQLEAIELFITRCGKGNYAKILSKFPACARIENRDEYPDFLNNLLAEIGTPQIIPNFQTEQERNSVLDKLYFGGCLLIGLVLLVLVVVGAFTVAMAIATRFSG